MLVIGVLRYFYSKIAFQHQVLYNCIGGILFPFLLNPFTSVPVIKSTRQVPITTEYCARFKLTSETRMFRIAN